MFLGFNESMNDISGYEFIWMGKGFVNVFYFEFC